MLAQAVWRKSQDSLELGREGNRNIQHGGRTGATWDARCMQDKQGNRGETVEENHGRHV